MFRLIALLFFAVASLIWFGSTCVLRSSDIAEYKKMLHAQESASTDQTLSSCAYQTRQGVRKDIWATQEDNSRLHYRIESASSLISMHVKQHHFDIVENLEKLRCWMQDKLYFSSEHQPMQQVRYFEADQGTYHYSTQKFEAQTVALSLMRTQGHSLKELDPKSAFIHGIAQDVSFCISGRNPQFHAQNFKAHFTPNQDKVIR